MGEVIIGFFPQGTPSTQKFSGIIDGNCSYVSDIIDYSEQSKKRLREEFIRFFGKKIDIHHVNISEASISINIDGSLCFFGNFITPKGLLTCDMTLLKEKILLVLPSQIKIEDISNMYREGNDFIIHIRTNTGGAFKVSL